ncbi:MAG: hypothetical protein ACFCU5_16845 [Pleurocapsa sp.]
MTIYIFHDCMFPQIGISTARNWIDKRKTKDFSSLMPRPGW